MSEVIVMCLSCCRPDSDSGGVSPPMLCFNDRVHNIIQSPVCTGDQTRENTVSSSQVTCLLNKTSNNNFMSDSAVEIRSMYIAHASGFVKRPKKTWFGNSFE